MTTLATITRVTPLNREPASFKLAPATKRGLEVLSKRTGKSQARVIDDLVNERLRQETPAQIEERLRVVEGRLDEVIEKLGERL